MAPNEHRPAHGLTASVGLGFRAALADALLAADRTTASFVEVAPENHLGVGGRRGRRLAAAAERWPVVCHGLCGDFAGAGAVDDDLVVELGHFLRRYRARWYSDHLCYTHVAGAEVHDLLPLPHTDEAVERVAARVRALRDRLELPLAVENVSAYVRAPTPPGARVLDEADFVRAAVEAADCLLLLDVNNVYVNAINFGFDADEYIDRLPLERVVQIHIAGHLVDERDEQGRPSLLIDTHGAPVVDAVYGLLQRTLVRMRERGLALPPVLLERDHEIPPLPELERELVRLRAIVDGAVVGGGAGPDTGAARERG
jgi:uncharacterized protein (UPF0276 family)